MHPNVRRAPGCGEAQLLPAGAEGLPSSAANSVRGPREPQQTGFVDGDRQPASGASSGELQQLDVRRRDCAQYVLGGRRIGATASGGRARGHVESGGTDRVLDDDRTQAR